MSNSSNKAMVAVCDILGFGDLVITRPLQEVVYYHIKNYQAALASSIPQFPNVAIQPSDREIITQGLVGYVAFSDTVVIYSLTDNYESYRNVINAVSRLLARHIKWPNLRFRIGIDYGDFYGDIEKNIYVGRALVEAHELEKRQNWCGAALTNTAAEKINRTSFNNNFLTRYDVPIKGTQTRQTESLMVIDWTKFPHKKVNREFSWLPREYGFGIPITEKQHDMERKLSNTEIFHLEKCDLCKVSTDSLS
jgi:hypothetical protein